VSTEGPLAHLREHKDVIEADLALMSERLAAGARVLDVGAGRGSFVKEARRQGFAALALEMDAGAIAVWSPSCCRAGWIRAWSP